MNICPKCHEEVEDNFGVCWNCGYSFLDDEVLDMSWADDNDTMKSSINCLRCNVKMHFSGKYSLGRYNRSLFSKLTGILRHQEYFDTYLCPKCGKVEFFVPLDK